MSTRLQSMENNFYACIMINYEFIVFIVFVTILYKCIFFTTSKVRRLIIVLSINLVRTDHLNRFNG